MATSWRRLGILTTALILTVASDNHCSRRIVSFLAVCAVIQHRQSLAALLRFALPRSALHVAVISCTATLASLFCWTALLLIAQAPDELETARWDGLGRVLLFPCRTVHSRLFPQKHSFVYSYLTVGVPVGFKGGVGGLVSIVSGNKKQGLLSWLWPEAWFTVDARDYLQRGGAELGLRGKLDEYLRTQVSDEYRHLNQSYPQYSHRVA